MEAVRMVLTMNSPYVVIFFLLMLKLWDLVPVML